MSQGTMRMVGKLVIVGRDKPPLSSVLLFVWVTAKFPAAQVFDAKFVVKLKLWTIYSEHWVLNSHKTKQVGTLEAFS